MAKDWRHMQALEMSDDPTVPVRARGLGISSPQVGRGVGVTIHFAEPVLQTQREGRAGLSRAYPGWSDRRRQDCPTCLVCPAALSDLEAAWVDPLGGVVLIVLRIRGGSDICPEHGPTYHTVRY